MRKYKSSYLAYQIDNEYKRKQKLIQKQKELNREDIS